MKVVIVRACRHEIRVSDKNFSRAMINLKMRYTTFAKKLFCMLICGCHHTEVIVYKNISIKILSKDICFNCSVVR